MTTAMNNTYLTIKEASEWATSFLGKEVTTSNISYLIQYGRIPIVGENGASQIFKQDLVNYYEESSLAKENKLKEKLGNDLNWTLSFSEYKEAETTKHVHRLHPYKGKFIPQLVEYFLGDKTDNFKNDVFFKEGDIVLDPFCGSGTTLIQANELGINAVGIDVSVFNSLICNSKVAKYDLKKLSDISKTISKDLKLFIKDKKNEDFEKELLEELKVFNSTYFPSPEFKRKVHLKTIDEKEYGASKEMEFQPIYDKLVTKYNIDLKQEDNITFLDKWFIKVVRDEMNFLCNQIEKQSTGKTREILKIILSRTARSCRATTHSDLATLFDPILAPYYCKKHGKICKPLFSVQSWWNRYVKDTIKRLQEFDDLRTKTHQVCLTGDSRSIKIESMLKEVDTEFANLLENRKIDGIFSSPPYVGLIDYHEQHAYSYDLFGLERKDELEIGPLYKGQGKQAQDSYVEGIADVLNNSKKYLIDDYNIFLVANDKNNLYPRIAELAGMKIVNQYKRPVLNRVEKDRNAYSEIIFHLKEGVK